MLTTYLCPWRVLLKQSRFLNYAAIDACTIFDDAMVKRDLGQAGSVEFHDEWHTIRVICASSKGT